MSKSKVDDGSKRKLFDDEGDEGSSDDSSSSNNNNSSDSSHAGSSPDNIGQKKKRGILMNQKDENPTELKISSSYAKEYTSRKQREELRSKQQRNGGRDLLNDLDRDDYDSEGSDSSSSSEEDEDGTLITPSMNLKFLKTIKALRSKESSVYNKETQFFEDGDEDGEDDDDDEGNAGKDKKSAKRKSPMHFKDVVRHQILEQIDAEEEGNKGDFDDNEKVGDSSSRHRLNYNEQQEELRKAFLKESKMPDDGSSSDYDDENGSDQNWMVVKKKHTPTAESDGDDDDVAEKELIQELQNSSNSRSSTMFVDPRGEIEDGDRFLLDYIKNKKWIDKSYKDDGDDSDDGNEGADDGDRGDGGGIDGDDESSLDDIDRADDFEANYNFRFEQAAAETATSGAAYSVQSYARGQTMNTLRRKDETRRDKRLARKERKIAERKAKEEELKRLKNAKKEEMNQKLSQIKSILGEVDGDAIDEDAIMTMLEGDYDPDKFQKAMESAYGDSFYERDETEWKTDNDVRESLKKDDDGDALVGQDDLDGGLYDGDYEDGEDEDDGDAEYHEENNDDYDASEEIEANSEFVDEETSKLERKLKSKMQEELYKLDYEDIVAGMPTRFKYRQVEPNNYGLTTEEILLARDTTLKQYVSLKKLAPYGEYEHAVGSKKRRRFREALMQELQDEEDETHASEPAETIEETNAEEGDSNEPQKKKRRRLKKGKKKSSKIDVADDKAEPGNSETNQEDPAAQPETKRKRRKKGKKGDEKTDDAPVVADSQDGKDPAEKLDKYKTRDLQYKKKKKKRKKIAGVSASRLASYGL